MNKDINFLCVPTKIQRMFFFKKENIAIYINNILNHNIMII